MKLPEGTKLALAWICGVRFANRICERSKRIEEEIEDEDNEEGDDGIDQ